MTEPSPDSEQKSPDNDPTANTGYGNVTRAWLASDGKLDEVADLARSERRLRWAIVGAVLLAAAVVVLIFR